MLLSTVGLVIILIVILMLIRVPVAFAFGIGTIILLHIYDIDPSWAFSGAFSLIQSYVFLALPAYILLGAIVNESGAARRISDWFNSMFRVKGGLGMAAVLTNGVFGAMSGASLAALAGIGKALLPIMEEDGYPKSFSIGVLIPSATLSLMIPPSAGMIIFGYMGDLPISQCFLAPLFPGLIVMVSLAVICLVRARNIPTIIAPPKLKFKETIPVVLKTTKLAALALVLPLFCLGGIYAGWYTPTEASAVGIVYAAIIGLFFYRGLTIGKLMHCLADAAVTTGSIVVLIFVFVALSKVMIVMQMSDKLLALFLAVSDNLYIQILLLNMLMLFMGMIMDDSSTVIIGAIVLLPVAVQLGIDPFHMAAMASLNFAIGIITPPVGPLLYFGGHLAKLPLNRYFKDTAIFVVFGMGPALLLTMYVPWLSTYLPHLLMGK